MSEQCKGCNGYGMVGNILDSDTCPFCKGDGAEPAVAPLPTAPAPTERHEAENVQRAKIAEHFANRPKTRATADFDLPAPNDEIAAPTEQADDYTLDDVDLARRLLTEMGRAIGPSREPGANRDVDRLAALIGTNFAARQSPQSKLTLSLPDYETRRIVIASDDVIDGERIVCVAIKGAAEQAGELPVRWANRACADNRRLSDTHYMQAEIDELRAALAARQAPTLAVNGDAIAKSKRILNLVDDYKDVPNADNRTKLRKALMDEFEAVGQSPDSRDAARYRLLREEFATSAIPRVWQSNDSAEPVKCLLGEELDLAIDAATAQEKAK